MARKHKTMRHAPRLACAAVALACSSLASQALAQVAQPQAEAARLAAAAQRVAGIEISSDRDGVAANGRDGVVLLVRLLDRDGAPLRGEVPVTLETSRGRFVAADTKDSLDAGVDREFALGGTQVLARDGTVVVRLQSPSEPGIAQVRVSAGGRSAALELSFVPDMREMIATGIVEGVVNFSRSKGTVLLPARAADGFEQELRRWTREFSDGRGAYGARTAFFLKGSISGQTLLTAAYDSDKDVRARLLRDIKPEEFYPVYGDASEKGFDAQTAGRLYVRLDNGSNFLLWGDFTTASGLTNPASQLGRYSRALTGAQGQWRFGGEKADRVQVRGFASKDTLRQVVDELPARGISGPYTLRYPNGVAGTERVELVVRDRNAPSVVLSVTPLVRFVDYDFEPFSGRLLFKAPVPSLDANLNPVSIRTAYEVEDSGASYWVYGADATVAVNDVLSVGASAARDENPLASYRLAGVNASLKLSPRTTAVAEIAESRGGQVTNYGFTPGANGSIGLTAAERQGRAMRVELQHEGSALQLRAYGQHVGAGFENPTAGAGLGSARTDAGGKATYAITETVRLSAQALTSRDDSTGGKREGVYLGGAWDVLPTVTAELGVRHARQTGAGATLPATGAAGSLPGTTASPVTGASQLDPAALVTTGNSPYASDSVKGRIAWRPTPAGTVYAEAERVVSAADGDEAGHAVAVGGDYRFAEVGRAYVRSERASGLGGDYGLAGSGRQSATVLGMDAPYMKDGQLFSEYRLRDGISGRDAVAAAGVRNAWRVAEGLRLSTTLERVKVLDGAAQEGRAATLGLDYLGSDVWKGSTRIEWREDEPAASAPGVVSWLHSAALARKLDEDWTLLARNLYLRRDSTAANADSTQDRFQVGAAWRQTQTNVWSALGRYEYWLREDQATLEDSRTQIVSTDVTFHPRRPLWVFGKAAAKWVDSKLGCIVDPVTNVAGQCVAGRSNAQLLQLRALYDISPRWDVGVMAAVLGEGGMRNRSWAYGLEAGHIVADNVWVSAGYNFKGIVDRDLATDGTQQGVYLKLRVKFDESLWARGKASLDRSVNQEGGK